MTIRDKKKKKKKKPFEIKTTRNYDPSFGISICRPETVWDMCQVYNTVYVCMYIL